MKVLTGTVNVPVAAERGMFGTWCELVKARLTFLVLVTAWVGFYVGQRDGLDVVLMVHLLMGTGLVAGAAAALNQWLEREHDGRMRRTEDRPLPSGQLRPEVVLMAGVGGSVLGLVYMWFAVNALTAGLGAVTLLVYLFVYTPLKRVTWLNTLVGAVPGALPPLMGWAAARGELGGGGWILFWILALWQMPHFLAIAWMYRDDYERAGFAMLPRFDVRGQRTAWLSLVCTVLLVGTSLLPGMWGMSGGAYVMGALVLGGVFTWLAVRWVREVTDGGARYLFYASILYLPLLLGLLAMDKR